MSVPGTNLHLPYVRYGSKCLVVLTRMPHMGLFVSVSWLHFLDEIDFCDFMCVIMAAAGFLFLCTGNNL
jgi:hypothetical protein